jgi:hypothetical protein
MAGGSQIRATAAQAWRRATSRWRALPDFVIIGAQKCGTSSLYAWMARSEGIRPASAKELHYFDEHHDRGVGWYRAQFPWRGRWVTGEATPSLLYDEAAPARLADLLPEARLIVLLRDPVVRAHSHYQHQVRKGREDLSFAEALAAEPERLAAGATSRRRYSYRDRGRYAAQLERWFRYVPRERFLILRSEDVFARPQEALDAACDWVGAPRAVTAGTSANTYGYPDADPAVLDALRASFAPENERLAALLGDERFLWRDLR